MKNRKLVAVIVATLLAIGATFALAGCGKTDWSKASWADYDPAVYMTKDDVAYSLGRYSETPTSGKTAFLSCHLMLYKDGSAASFLGFDKKGIFPIKTGIAAYDDNEINVALYGYWTQEGNTIKIHLKGIVVSSFFKEGKLVEADKDGNPLTLESILENSYDYEYEAELADGVLTVVDFQGWGAGGAGFGEPIIFPVQSGSPYKTMKEARDAAEVMPKN